MLGNTMARLEGEPHSFLLPPLWEGEPHSFLPPPLWEGEPHSFLLPPLWEGEPHAGLQAAPLLTEGASHPLSVKLVMSENGFRFATGLGMPLLLTMYRPFCSTTRVLFRARARLLDAASPFHLSMSSNTDITKSFSTEVEDGLLACRLVQTFSHRY